MKILEDILLFVFVLLGLLPNKLEAKAILHYEKVQTTFFQETIIEESAEKEWLGLLYLQEEKVFKDQKSFTP